jgi:hypothetical protein
VLTVNKEGILDLTREDLLDLLDHEGKRPHTGWLNDRIISFYMDMLSAAGLAGTRRRICHLPFWAHLSHHNLPPDSITTEAVDAIDLINAAETTTTTTSTASTRQEAVTAKLLSLHNKSMRGPGTDKALAPCLQSTDAFSFAINQGGGHWNTVTIDIARGFVGRYDSVGFRGKNAGKYKDIVQNTQVALHTIAKAQQVYFEKEQGLHQLSNYEPKPPVLFSGDQDDGRSCGVYSLATLDFASDGLDPFPPSTKKPHRKDYHTNYVGMDDIKNLRERFALEMLKGELVRTTYSPTSRPDAEGKPGGTRAAKEVQYIPSNGPGPTLSLWQKEARFEKKKGECDALELSADKCDDLHLDREYAGTYCYVCALQIDKDGSVYEDSAHKHEHFKSGKVCKDSSRGYGWCVHRVKAAKEKDAAKAGAKGKKRKK